MALSTWSRASPGLPVHQVGGEGGGWALGQLIEEGIALHGALGGGGEAARLVERDPLQVEVERDVLRARIVDGRIAVGAEVLAQPLGGQGPRTLRCGLGEGRLRRLDWPRRRGRSFRRRLRLELALVPEPTLLPAEIEARGFRPQRKRERQTEVRRQQGTHVGDHVTGSSP